MDLLYNHNRDGKPELPFNKVTPQHRHAWCLTINNPKYDDSFYVKLRSYDPGSGLLHSKNVVYYAVQGKEGVGKTLHYQIFIYFVEPLSFTEVKLLFPRAHVESALHSPLRAVTYCKKENEWREIGSYELMIHHYLSF